MPKTPPIPPEQRAFSADKVRDRLRSAQPDRRDETAELQSSQPGDDDVNLKTQGRYADTRQNLHHQQDR